MKKPKFKPGDQVMYKDGDEGVYIVYAVYSPTKVSLGLREYSDVEQDEQVDTSKIKHIGLED